MRRRSRTRSASKFMRVTKEVISWAFVATPNQSRTASLTSLRFSAAVFSTFSQPRSSPHHSAYLQTCQPHGLLRQPVVHEGKCKRSATLCLYALSSGAQALEQWMGGGRPGGCRLVLEGGTHFLSYVSHALHPAVALHSLQECVCIFPAQPLGDAATLQWRAARVSQGWSSCAYEVAPPGWKNS